MPSLVVIIALLSFLSFLYSVNIFKQEIRRTQLVTQTFGTTLDRRLEQILRLSTAALFTALSLITVLMSAALIWLATQPGMVG